MSTDIREYKIPTRGFSRLILILLLIFIWAMWIYRPDQLTASEKAVVLLVVFIPALLILWMMKSIHVRLNDSGIISSYPFGTKKIEWQDVEDLVVSDRLIIVRDSKSREIKLFRSEFGAVQPFEDLREKILKNVGDRIKLLWGKTLERFVVSYPPLSGLNWLGYAIPFSVVVLLLTTLFIRVGYSLVFLISALIVVALIVGPLLVRDTLKARKSLTVSSNGLVCEGGGRRIELSWEEIGQIIIKEPLTIGYGKIVVRPKTGGQSIVIPRSTKKSGYVLYLLQSRTSLVSSQSFDY